MAALAPEAAPPGATPVAPLLDEARERELIFRRERSSFSGSQEYIFKHLILHDVTYETVLLKLRKVYHRQVAQWLEANAGERAGEYAGLIAEHYERAGEATLAARWLQRTADTAGSSAASREAIAAAERGLALLPEGEKGARAEMLSIIGTNHRRMGNCSAAEDNYNAALTLAREAGDQSRAARVLCGLAFLAYERGAFAEIEAPASEAVALARAIGDQAIEATALLNLGIAARDPAVKTRLYEEGMALRRKIGDKGGISACLNNLGEVARSRGDYPTARRYY